MQKTQLIKLAIGRTARESPVRAAMLLATLASAAVVAAVGGCAADSTTLSEQPEDPNADVAAAAARLSESLGTASDRRADGLTLRGGDPWGASRQAPRPRVPELPIGPPAPTPEEVAAAATDAAEGDAATLAGATPPVSAPIDPTPPAPAITPPSPASAAPAASRASAQIAAADGPLAEAMRLALAEVMGDPAAADALRAAQPSLNTVQLEKLAAFRAVIAELHTSETGDESATSEALLARLRERLAAIEGNRPLAIPTAALAQRVDGFGKYVPFASRKFVAGRAHETIVYVEVSNFSAAKNTGLHSGDHTGFRHIDAPAEPGDPRTEWVVELGQELLLYHSDGVLAVHRAEQKSRDVSLRKRSDHFLIQRLTLPANLTIGSYTLKVRVRDLANGSQAEASIPIEVVADARLTKYDTVWPKK